MPFVAFALAFMIVIAPNVSASERVFRWAASIDVRTSAPLAQQLPHITSQTDGGSITLPGEFEGSPFLIVVRDADCPVARRYAPRIRELERDGLPVVFLLVGDYASVEHAKRDRERHEFTGSYILDADRTLSNWLGVRTIGEVYLFDAGSRLRYRGAIDDQYGIGFSKRLPTQHFLADALAAVRSGLLVSEPATISPGCVVGGPTKREVKALYTYYGDARPIFQAKCEVCHRPDQAGPFPLQTYEQINQRRSMIRFVLANKIMPPWNASGDPDRWKGHRQLAASERQILIDWIDTGATEGDSAIGTAPIDWDDGWQFGEPDVILRAPKTIAIPAEGVIDYKYVLLPTEFSEDRWVKSLEIQSDAPQNTHHILIFAVPPEQAGRYENLERYSEKSAERLSADLIATRGFFSVYAPGTPGISYPEGMGKKLPRGWYLLLQIHHQPNGRASSDRPRIGLRLAKSQPPYSITTIAAKSLELHIPPYAAAHRETAVHKFDHSGRILGFYPHMHLRGSAFRYEMRARWRGRQTLLDVPRYDPNWQLYYQLTQPLEVRSGSRLHVTAVYDNSAANPLNPDPGKNVFFGLQTEDEMMIGYFDWVPDDPENLKRLIERTQEKDDHYARWASDVLQKYCDRLDRGRWTWVNREVLRDLCH